MSNNNPSPEDLIAALRDGRSVTTHANGTIEIGPEEPIDPEEQARVDAFIERLGVEPEDDGLSGRIPAGSRRLGCAQRAEWGSG